MKNLLLILAVTSFAFAGAIQKEEPKKTTVKKTAIAKKSPTPSKKSNTTAKKSPPPAKKASAAMNKETQKKSASTTNSKKKTTAGKQPPKPQSSTPKTKPKSVPTRKDDKADLEKALAIEDPDRKIAELTKFLKEYPRSAQRPRALESLTAARIAFGDANLEAGDPEYGLKLIREALREAPVPYPEKLFVEIISKVPTGLHFRGEQKAAVEAAVVIEKNVASSAPSASYTRRFLSFNRKRR